MRLILSIEKYQKTGKYNSDCYSMSKEKIRVAVFGSSEVKSNQPEYISAVDLGAALSSEGWEVLTGGYYGVMEAVSKGVQSVNGVSIGVTLSSFDPKPPNSYLSVNHHESDLFSRMRRLIDDSNAIVVLYGGLGTLAEFSVAWVLKQVGILSRDYPIILLGDSFETIVHAATQSLCVKASDVEFLIKAKTINDVISSLQVFERQRTFIRPTPVTIGIAAYNAETYIEESVVSAFEQTKSAKEVVVVNDGSTDNTLKILRDLQEKYDSLKVVNQINMGTPGALNHLISLCRTDYLLGLDADDTLEKDAVEVLYNAATIYPEAAIIYSDYIFVDEQGHNIRSIRNPDSENLVERLLLLHQRISIDNKDNFLPYGHARLYRVDCLRGIGGYATDILYADDYDLVLRLAERWSFAHVPKFLYRYRWHGSNKSILYREAQVEDVNESVRRHKWRMSMQKKV
jgi:uncharacterized protein (TIGR00730 family)